VVKKETIIKSPCIPLLRRERGRRIIMVLSPPLEKEG